MEIPRFLVGIRLAYCFVGFILMESGDMCRLIVARPFGSRWWRGTKNIRRRPKRGRNEVTSRCLIKIVRYISWWKLHLINPIFVMITIIIIVIIVIILVVCYRDSNGLWYNLEFPHPATVGSHFDVEILGRILPFGRWNGGTFTSQDEQNVDTWGLLKPYLYFD